MYSRLIGLSNMAKVKTLNVVQSTEKIKTASQYTNNLVNCECFGRKHGSNHEYIYF